MVGADIVGRQQTAVDDVLHAARRADRKVQSLSCADAAARGWQAKTGAEALLDQPRPGALGVLTVTGDMGAAQVDQAEQLHIDGWLPFPGVQDTERAAADRQLVAQR